MRIWGGRFDDEPDARMADYTRSIEVDAELALDDLAGSIAHVRGLGRAGLLTEDEVRVLERGLASLRDDVAAGRVAWDPTLEDVHLNLETLLTERVGAVGGKLHTGRSRNDQVATDLRLWTRRAVARLDEALLVMERALVDLADREGDAVLPGATHIQPAQPVLFAHHLLAYVEMLERDRDVSRTQGAGSTSRRSGRGHSPGPAIPSTVTPRPPSSGSTGSPRTRSTPWPTGTSSWRCRPRRRSRWSTSRGWRRSSRGGRTRASAGCGSPTRSRPARR